MVSIRPIWGLALVCGLAATAAAEEVSASGKPDARRGGDELLLFEELPQVVSASRQQQPMNQSAAPVSVVSAEDIHYGGQTTLPEVLQFVPGVDVLQVDRNRYAVSVRGLHDVFSDRTLALIDGRNAESPTFGGPEWLRYPLFMEDIERIEVVRGPGGAAWGANAFNGVVNVITKRPDAVQGVLATATVDEYGDTYSQVRWGAKKDRWSWRTSFGYEEVQSSEDAIRNDKFRSNDYRTSFTGDGEAQYKVSDDTRVRFGAGHQHKQVGDFEFQGALPRADGTEETTRAFVRAEHKVNEKLSGYVQWSGAFQKSDNPSLQKSHSNQNDFEAQANLKIAPRHELAIGGNVRWMEIGTNPKRAQDIRFQGTPVDEYFAGAFLLYHWHINDRLTFELQGRGDWYSETQTDWSARTALIYALDGEKRHTLRFAGARAFRTPFIGLRGLQMGRFALPEIPGLIPPGRFGLNLVPNQDLNNESIVSLEFGYTGHLAKGLTVRFDNYYQWYRDLIGFERVGVVDYGFAQEQFFSARHSGGAAAYGSELEVAYSHKRGRISGWVAYNAFDPEFTGQSLRSFLPAPFKAGISGRAYLPHEVVLNLNYRYTSHTHGDLGNDWEHAQVSHRLDAAVAKRFMNERFELQFGVNDILNRTRDPVRAMGGLSDHDTPGRTFYGRIQLKF